MFIYFRVRNRRNRVIRHEEVFVLFRRIAWLNAKEYENSRYY